MPPPPENENDAAVEALMVDGEAVIVGAVRTVLDELVADAEKPW